MRIILRALGLVTAVTLVAGCGDDGDGDDGGGSPAGRPTVATSFYPIAEVTRGVAGDGVTVIDLTPAGAEPHDVELTPRQVDRARTADVLFYLGEHFQPAVEELAEQVEGEAVDLLEGLPIVEGDPHVWLDPVLMRDVVQRVRDVLSEVDPDGADDYEAGADRYLTRLESLDAAFREELVDCDRNVVVTSHASLRYLTGRYGLEQEAIAESPEVEPDPARLAELTELIREAGVTTIFTEPLVAEGAATALARETGVATAVVDPLENGEPHPEGAGYFTIMDRNLQALAAGLGCR